MYRSTGETMAKLRSVNLKLTFDIYYNKKPVVVKYKGKNVNQIDLLIESIDQKEQISFEGFVPDDPTQKISCLLWHEDDQVDMAPISSLQMQNNQYVTNKKIPNCKEVHFNGVLTLNFCKQWFKHKILSGANLDESFTNWDQVKFTDEEVFCIGDSFTYGHGVARNETWPEMLHGKICNFGSKGLSHDGCLKNVKFILENSKHVKKVICLLPSPTRKLFEFEFLGCTGTIPISLNSNVSLPKEFASDVNSIKNFIVNENIENDWIQSCLEIIDICRRHQVQCWISTWDESMYKHIPATHRLPMFPKIDTFKERASDDQHPHKRHYELFVKNIQPYVDKT